MFNLICFILLMCNYHTPILRYVHNPNRLHIINKCQMISGKVKKIIKESDGDLHIRVRLDKQYSKFLNSKNFTKQDSCLVIEIMPTDDRTIVKVPKVDNHIQALVCLVYDKDHGWNEGHPTWKLDAR